MIERFHQDAQADLDRLARNPGHAGALTSLCAAFAEAAREPGASAQVAQAAENLLNAQLEGFVTPSSEAAELVAAAAQALADGETGTRADLVERLDAVASGMSGVDLDPLPPSDNDTPNPPVLTEREDGTFVNAGTFPEELADNPPPSPAAFDQPDDGALNAGAAIQETPPLAAFDQPDDRALNADAAIQETPPLAAFNQPDDGAPSADAAIQETPPPAAFDQPNDEALNADAQEAPPQVAEEPYENATPGSPTLDMRQVVDRVSAAINGLDRHIVALVTIADGNDKTSAAVQQTAGELAATAAEIKHGIRTLANWVDANAPDITGGPK